MKIKVAIYGFGTGIGKTFFGFAVESDFRNKLNLGCQLTFDRKLQCDELEGEVVPCDRSFVPRFYFADFELQCLQVLTPGKLDELAVRFGGYFSEYIFRSVNKDAFVGVRVTAGRLVANYSPHHYKLK
jgi:hypothetical protein